MLYKSKNRTSAYNNYMNVCGREAAKYFYAQRPLKIIWNKNIPVLFTIFLEIIIVRLT